MSTTTTEDTLQRPLAGLAAPPPPKATTPPAQRHADAGEPIKCCFMGHLAHAATVRTEGLDTLLEVQLRQRVPQHPNALPVLGTWLYPAGPDPVATLHRAKALAARLPAGTPVVLLGRGLESAHHRGEPVLRVLDVLGVRAETELRAATPPTTYPTQEGLLPC